MVFKEATSEPYGKIKKLTACRLMPHNKYLGKKGCICQFFNPFLHPKGLWRTLTGLKPFYYDLPEVKNCWIFV